MDVTQLIYVSKGYGEKLLLMIIFHVIRVMVNQRLRITMGMRYGQCWVKKYGRRCTVGMRILLAGWEGKFLMKWQVLLVKLFLRKTIKLLMRFIKGKNWIGLCVVQVIKDQVLMIIKHQEGLLIAIYIQCLEGIRLIIKGRW